MTSVDAAGLYLHVPFCSAICPYCDFAVQVGKAPVRARFIDTLRLELATIEAWTAPIDTIYLGGGTPSLLDAAQLSTLIDAVHGELPVSADATLHLEANPEDVNPRNVEGWRALGVRFLSLGVQSFDDAELKTLGRRHTGAEAREAVKTCLEAGFHTLSVDVMFGLPLQTKASLARTLAQVVELQPQHASCYQLTVHEGTTYWRWRERGKLRELDDETQGELYAQVHETLGAAGLHAYEVSNFAIGPLHRSAHNQKYWRHAPYLGLGPSAHSFDGHRRWWNTRDLEGYSKQLERGERPLAGSETLTASDLALESLMLGVRTTDGIDLGVFAQRFHIDIARTNAALISELCRDGLLEHSHDRLRPTGAGLAVADWIAASFEL